MSEVYFRRKPYTVVYKDFHTGELQRVRRRPPPKLHAALPHDVVELTRTKNEHFQMEEDYKVKHISQRAPNTIQLQNEEGLTTFVSNFEINLKEKVGGRSDVHALDSERSAYLLWP